MDVQVPKHFDRVPMADEVDDDRVDLGWEEGCCTSGVQAQSQDYRRKEAKVRAQRRD